MNNDFARIPHLSSEGEAPPSFNSAAPAELTAPNDETAGDKNKIPEELPLLPSRDTVVFPGTVMPLAIPRRKSRRVLDQALAGSGIVAVVTQHSSEVENPVLDDLYRVGTACRVLKMLQLPDGTESIIVHGLKRVGIEDLISKTDYMRARVHAHTDPDEITLEQKALAHTIRTAAERIIELSPNIPSEAAEVLRAIERPGALADFLAANLSLGLVYKQELLETFDITDRLRKVNAAVAAQLEVVELSSKIQDQVRAQVDKSQREYLLREQMKAIQHELGDADQREESLTTLRKRIEAADLPPVAKAEAERELERLGRIPAASPEYSTALDYVEWLSSLPWNERTPDNLDLAHAEQVLDEDHYGLTKVKRRIIEFLAVRTLKADTRGPILCFAGPPGVGKTSLGQSIARAMGRKFIRVSLGGIHDEAVIRGHRRTYVGAMPGRIIREIRRAGCRNPLFMLDEVDKVGDDFRGDPMSALLEVLDPAQNSTFSDHYLAVPFDLSDVLFICTANYMGAVEAALRDRMEVIELSSYPDQDKLMIAKRHLVPRQLKENGLTPELVEFDDKALSLVISNYTREAGVRSLERQIGALCRARAALIARGQPTSPAINGDEIRRVLGPREYQSELAAKVPLPGVATGLAYTPNGGEILFVEASLMPGTGQLRLTGQLGEVMRESALAASTIIRNRFANWRIEDDIYQKTDLHIHVPAGAIPKDGPSAGVTMLVAVLSALTNRPVDPLMGLTGEITLSGRVLPVGGITEKIIAGHRAGLKTIVLPKRNEDDLTEIPQETRDQLKFVFVETVEELLADVFPAQETNKKQGRKRARKSNTASGTQRAFATRNRPRMRASETQRASRIRRRTIAPKYRTSRKIKHTAARARQ